MLFRSADRHFIVTDRRESLFGVRTAISVGHMEPLTASAFGLAILGELDEETLVGLELELAEIGDSAAQQSGGRPVAVPEAMRRAAARGYAVRLGLGNDGVTSIAAPILDFLGRPIAAIGIVAPASRLALDQLHSLAPDVIDAARRVTLNAGNSLQSIEPLARPTGQVDLDVWQSIPTSTLLGKTAHWHHASNALYLADIFGPTILAIASDNGPAKTIARPDMGVVCGWSESGDLIFADGRGVFRHDATGEREVRIAEFPRSQSANRLNNSAIDPNGGVWLTSMNIRAHPGEGEVLRVRNGRMETVFDNLSVPSGLAWTADGRRLYLVDSGRRLILTADYDPDSGRVGPLSEFMRLDPSEGTPDGMAVDRDGGIWVAMWDGWSILRFDANGQRTRRIDMPIPRPAGLSFGGPDGRTLYVTTARIRLSSRVLNEAPLSGRVFWIRTEHEGVASSTISHF
mgnify:FL=1